LVAVYLLWNVMKALTPYTHLRRSGFHSKLNAEKEWLSLETECTEDFTYFQNYNWCIEYYKQFADDLTNKHCPIPQVFVLRRDKKPIMIWPLMRIQSRVGLKILATATEPLGQYANLLFDQTQFDEIIGKRALDLIIKHSKSDLVSLNNYPENSMIDKIIGTIISCRSGS